MLFILFINIILGRVLNCLGLKQYNFDVDYAEEKVEEGKFLIERYRNEKILDISSSLRKTSSEDTEPFKVEK